MLSLFMALVHLCFASYSTPIPRTTRPEQMAEGYYCTVRCSAHGCLCSRIDQHGGAHRCIVGHDYL